MTNADDSYVPFSQRTGLRQVPPQLKVGELSSELRRLVFYYIQLGIERGVEQVYGGIYFKDGWRRLAMDLHVVFFKQKFDESSSKYSITTDRLREFVEDADIGELFDLIEFLIMHDSTSRDFMKEIANAFVTARAAYRIFDNKYVAAIGTEEQAAAVQRAIDEAETRGATAARQQLIRAAVALRNSDWAGSVRESIHAVEATAVLLAPESKTLGAALKVLEQNGQLHGSLKAAFGSLYGYSSDQEGIRHALVFADEAKVDEADALFMLGACASFISYLLARST